MGIELLSMRPSAKLLQVSPRSLAENNFHRMDVCQSRATAITATFYPQEVSIFSVEDLKGDISLVFFCDASKHAISSKPCLISVGSHGR